MAITLSGTAITMNDSSTIVSTTTYGAIGSYAMWYNAQTSSVGVGSTIAGSSLTSTSLTASASMGGSDYRNAGSFLQSGGQGAQRFNGGPFGFETKGGGANQHANVPGLATGSGTWRNVLNHTIGPNDHRNETGEDPGQYNRSNGGLYARIS
jgi:hypothetical protein